MDLISLIVILAVIGVIVWAVNTFVPMDPKIKNILNIAVVVVVCLWLLDIFIGFSSLRIPVGRAR